MHFSDFSDGRWRRRKSNRNPKEITIDGYCREITATVQVNEKSLMTMNGGKMDAWDCRGIFSLNNEELM